MNLIMIGNYINLKRKEQGITQEQLGNKLGVSSQAISNWEQGKNLPDSSLLIDLSIILDCSIEQILMGGQEDRDSKKISVRNVVKGIDNLASIKDLLGSDNTFYRCMIDGIKNGMNTDIEELLSSNYLRELSVVEVLIQNVQSGHCVDHNEVRNILQYDKTKEIFFKYYNDITNSQTT
jgi:transcriptional regulator with XRE-family HTH domain